MSDNIPDLIDKTFIDTPELDNCMLRAEEMMHLFPWPIEKVAQLCREINDDAEAGHY